MRGNGAPAAVSDQELVATMETLLVEREAILAQLEKFGDRCASANDATSTAQQRHADESRRLKSVIKGRLVSGRNTFSATALDRSFSRKSILVSMSQLPQAVRC
jgi:hypothetical protein